MFTLQLNIYNDSLVVANTVVCDAGGMMSKSRE